MPRDFKLLIWLLLIAPVLRAHGEVLSEGWAFRRPLIFKQTPSDATGDNIAWGEFYSNGKQLSDWADLRVTTADRVILPIKIMQMSPNNDFVRVAFATHGDGPYFAWWGNAKAVKPAKDLDIHRGILLEVTTGVTRAVAVQSGGPGAGGAAGSVGTDRALYFVAEPSLGYNPQGDDHNLQLHYTGVFKIDPALKAQMVFAVGGVGSLEIDGTPLATEKGGLKSTSKDPFPVDLALGWHKLDVNQNILNQPNIAMELAWQLPGEKAFKTLPASVFAPVAHAVAGALENVGQPFTIDISVDPTAEAFAPPSFYLPRYVFEVQYPAALKPTIMWDFGDGQVSKGLKKANHVFLTPGTYPITVRLDNAGGTAPLLMTTRIQVHDRLVEKLPRPAEDPPKALQAVLKDYDPKKLTGDQAFRGVTFFDSINDAEDMITWGHAWLAAKDIAAPADSVVWEESWTMARAQIARKKYADAADIFRLAAAKATAPDMRARLLLHYVMEACDDAGDADGAMKEAKNWEGKIPISDKKAVSTMKAAECYAAVAQGDGKTAKAAADAASALAPPPTLSGAAANAAGTYNQEQIRKGVLARNVENYIRTRDFDTAWQLVDEWDLEFPSAIWEGFTRTLRVKLATSEGRDLSAARMALALARANPDGFYAAELLFDAFESFKAAGEPDQAKVALDLLKSKYPESPQARDAGK